MIFRGIDEDALVKHWQFQVDSLRGFVAENELRVADAAGWNDRDRTAYESYRAAEAELSEKLKGYFNGSPFPAGAWDRDGTKVVVALERLFGPIDSWGENPAIPWRGDALYFLTHDLQVWEGASRQAPLLLPALDAVGGDVRNLEAALRQTKADLDHALSELQKAEEAAAARAAAAAPPPPTAAPAMLGPPQSIAPGEPYPATPTWRRFLVPAAIVGGALVLLSRKD